MLAKKACGRTGAAATAVVYVTVQLKYAAVATRTLLQQRSYHAATPIPGPFAMEDRFHQRGEAPRTIVLDDGTEIMTTIGWSRGARPLKEAYAFAFHVVDPLTLRCLLPACPIVDRLVKVSIPTGANAWNFSNAAVHIGRHHKDSAAIEDSSWASTYGQGKAVAAAAAPAAGGADIRGMMGPLVWSKDQIDRARRKVSAHFTEIVLHSTTGNFSTSEDPAQRTSMRATLDIPESVPDKAMCVIATVEHALLGAPSAHVLSRAHAHSHLSITAARAALNRDGPSRVLSTSSA